MRFFTILFLMSLVSNLCSQELTEANSIYQFKVIDIDGNEFDFSCLEGKKIMLVNTASKCMYAPQMKKMQALYEKYKEKDFVIIAFPSRDFYNRELKQNEDIAKKYHRKYKISFPVMELTRLKGDSIHPIYDFLSHKDMNGVLEAPPKWNFHKYLINRNGFLHKSIPPANSPLNSEIIDWLTNE